MSDQLAQQTTRGRKAPVPANLSDEDVDVFLKGGDSLIGDLFANGAQGAKDAARIAKPCAEQFTGRVVLARCERHVADSDAGFRFDVTARYYNFGTVGRSDAYMDLCIKGKGDWEAVPHDSAEFHRARLEDDERRVHEAADRMRRGLH